MTDGDRSKALAELLATPLERDMATSKREERRTNRPAPWGTLVAMLLGAGVVLVGFMVASSESTDDTPATTTVAPTTSPAADIAAFPDGYTPVDDAVAAKVVRVAPSGEDLAVTLTSVAARGLDPDASTPFTGGRWAAVLRDGTTVPARGQIVDVATPGVVTALFDPGRVAGGDLVAVRLSERWFNQSTGATQPIDISDLPWVMPEPMSLELGDGVQLIVESMELSETGGAVEWSLAGGTALGIVSVEVALEEGSFDGQPRMMIPIARIDRFFFDPATSVPEGRIELSGPTAADGTGIARGFAFWSVRLTVTAPAEAEIPVPTFGS